MLKFAPELVAAVRQDYLYSDKTLVQIAAHYRINERDISRMRELEGWPARYARIRRVPRLTQALKETEALAAVSPLPTRSGGDTANTAFCHSRVSENPAILDVEKSAEPSVLGPRLRGDDTPGNPPALPAIERIERLVAQELAAEERARAELGAAPRRRADAERCARTLSTLTQIVHTLARLRGGFAPDSGLPHDDMPRDIDEFRRELARRIRVFVQSRTGGCVCNADRPADSSRMEP